MFRFAGTRLEKERRDAEAKKRERDEQHLYLTVKVSVLSPHLSLHSTHVYPL